MPETLLNRRTLLRIWTTFAAASAAVLTAASEAPADECPPTSPDQPGPFYIPGAPHRTVLVGPDEAGERLVIRGRVFGPDCRTPVARALLDLWHADAAGAYHSEKESYRLRGQLLTNARGEYEFRTIVPGRYKLGEGFRPAHIHFTVSAPGFEAVTSQIYFAGDPYLGPKDACGADCDSRDRNRIVALKKEAAEVRNSSAGTFNIVLRAATT